MNHYKRNNGALIGALGAVAALAATTAIGLALITQDPARRAPSVTPQQPAVMADEPELMRTDRANEHHG